MSADDRVQIEISTEAAQTLAAWRALQKEINKVTGELGTAKKATHGHGDGPEKAKGPWSHLTDKVKEFGVEAGKSAADTVVGFSSMAGGITTVVEGLREAIMAEKELRRERSKEATTEEEAVAAFSNQARTSGLNRQERQELAEKTRDVGAKFGVMGPESLALGTEAASQGVEAEAIPEFLEIAHKFAAAQSKRLDTDMFKAFVAQVRAQDDKLGTGAAQQVMQQFVGAFFKRQIQPFQLEAFSKVNRSLRDAGLTHSQQLATNIASLDLYGGKADEAAIFDRAFTSKLRAEETSPEKIGALAKLGLDTEDVDLIGEDIHEVLRRLHEGLQKVGEEERVPILGKLFGEEYGAKAASFIEDRDKVADIERDVFTGAPEAEAAAREYLETAASRQRIAKARHGAAMAKRGKSAVETGREVLDQILEEVGFGALRQKEARAAFELLPGETPIGVAEAVKMALALARPEGIDEKTEARVDEAMGTTPAKATSDAFRKRKARERRQVAADVAKIAAPEGQSEVVGADRDAAAELVQRQKEAKKIAHEAKAKAEASQKAQEKLDEFEARTAREAEEDAKLDAAKLSDEEANDAAQAEADRKREALLDSEYSQKHKGKSRPHAPRVARPKRERTAQEQAQTKIHTEKIARERAELTGERDQAHGEAETAEGARVESDERIEALTRRVPRLARELAREAAEQGDDRDEDDEARAVGKGAQPPGGDDEEEEEGRRGGEKGKKDTRRDAKQSETAAAQLNEQREANRLARQQLAAVERNETAARADALLRAQLESNRLAREQLAATRRAGDANRDAMRSMSRPAV